jgi:hypothetical protein
LLHFFVQRASTSFWLRFVGLSAQSSGTSPFFDGRVLVARIVVARHRHNGGVKDLPAPRNIPLPRQMTVEQPEQLLHLAGLRQCVAIKPDRLGIGHPVPETKPQKEL